MQWEGFSSQGHTAKNRRREAVFLLFSPNSYWSWSALISGMRLISQDTMSQYSTNFLLLPIPEYPVLDCVPNKIIKLVVLGGSSVGKTGKPAGIAHTVCLLPCYLQVCSSRPRLWKLSSPLQPKHSKLLRCFCCWLVLIHLWGRFAAGLWPGSVRTGRRVGSSVLTNESPWPCVNHLTASSCPHPQKWG